MSESETPEQMVGRIAAKRTGAKPSKASPKAKSKGKGKVGRPPKEPRVTPEVITDLAAIGCTNDELVQLTGLSEDTLERRFADIIEKGRARFRMSLRRQQYRTAMDAHDASHGTMLVWLGKVVLGQSEKAVLEVSGPNGGPIQHDLSEVPTAELVAEAEAILRASAGDPGRADPA